MSSKVFAREQAFIGLGKGRDLKILKGELYDADDEIVQKYPSLFAPVAESTDARVASLEAQVQQLLAALEAKSETPAKTAAKKTSAAAPADGKELKGEVA